LGKARTKESKIPVITKVTPSKHPFGPRGTNFSTPLFGGSARLSFAAHAVPLFSSTLNFNSLSFLGYPGGTGSGFFSSFFTDVGVFFAGAFRGVGVFFGDFAGVAGLGFFAGTAGTSSSRSSSEVNWVWWDHGGDKQKVSGM
jgi:hypothetical protein|tara:strand:+ start:1982 stop:2407 length:426 start_codon:yes stop_codon:yes gene_type:complete